LGGVSGESGLVRFSCGLWNDCENDHLSKQWLNLPTRCRITRQVWWVDSDGPHSTLDVDAQARRWRGSSSSSSVACSSSGVMSASARAREGMAGRHQLHRVVALLERAALGGGRLLDGELGQRVGLQPLVGIGWPLRTDRP
jgi:hypothetical protein